MNFTNLLLAWLAWEIYKDYRNNRVNTVNKKPTDEKFSSHPNVGTPLAGFNA